MIRTTLPPLSELDRWTPEELGHHLFQLVDAYRRTNMPSALKYVHEKDIATVVELGAEVVKSYYSLDDTVFHTVAKYSELKLAKFLLKRLGYTDLQNTHGYTALDCSITYGTAKMFRLFLKYGANPNNQNSDGNTSLHMAVMYNKIHLVKLILDNGASVNIQNGCGNTPLYYACLNGRTKIVNMLLEHGADPNIKCADGDTALHAITSRWRFDKTAEEITRNLVKHGVDPRIQNNMRLLPWDDLKSQDRRKILELMPPGYIA